MSFYLGKIKIPIFEAENIQVSRDREYENVKVLNGETVTILGKKGLLQIEYSSFFPKQYGSYCDVTESQLKKPTKYKQIIEDLRDGENYVLVRINELKVSNYFKITRASFGIENGVGDISYSISLEEYNKVSDSKSIYIAPVANETAAETQVVAMNTTALTGGPRESKTVEPLYHTVRSTDTTYKIAAKYNMNWKDIYEDNKSIIGNNPGLLIVGTKLYIRGTNTEKSTKILKLDSGRTVVVNHK